MTIEQTADDRLWRDQLVCRGEAGRIREVKASGSAWFGYGIAVVVTFLVGMLAFTVFVLSKVFGSSSPEERPAPVPQAVSSPTTATARPTAVGVMEVQVVKGNPQQVVLIVATPTGCAQQPQVVTYAEGAGAVAVRVTQRVYRSGCHLKTGSVLATAKAPIAGRTLLLNGVPWTVGADGEYQQALRTATS
jgi:Na+-transporting methylmalonyl-CoA/oxaloacetate decarboxylase gamma subunit